MGYTWRSLQPMTAVPVRVICTGVVIRETITCSNTRAMNEKDKCLRALLESAYVIDIVMLRSKHCSEEL